MLRDDRHRVAGERDTPDRALVEHHAQRIEVGAMVEPTATGLLGAHVVRRAADHARLVALLGEHREAEVGELRLVARRQQHVGRLHVAMDDPLMVRVVERLGHLRDDSQPFLERDQPPALQVARAVDFLHDEVEGAVRFAKVVHPHDVFVEQAGEDLGFEADLLTEIVAAVLLEHLDRDAALKNLVGGPINGPHAAPAQLRLERESLIEGRTDQGARSAPGVWPPKTWPNRS